MGVDIFGWVEVQDPTTHGLIAPRFPDDWEGVVRITNVVERNYDLFGYFFDVHNPFDFSVARRRGMPTRLSDEAEAERLEPRFPALTWIALSELRAARPQDLFEVPPGWNVIFTVMEDLGRVYGDERVRLVVWFDSDPDSWARERASEST